MMSLISAIIPALGPVIGWLVKRGLVKEEHAKNFYAMLARQGERQRWPVEHMDALDRARAKLDAPKEEG